MGFFQKKFTIVVLVCFFYLCKSYVCWRLHIYLYDIVNVLPNKGGLFNLFGITLRRSPLGNVII